MKRSCSKLVIAGLAVLLTTSTFAKTYKFGFGDPMSSDSGAFAQKFKEVVEAESNGKMKVRLFASGALGSETEMVLNNRMGSLPFAIVGIGNLVPFAEELGTLTLPYLMRDTEDAIALTTGDFKDQWSAIAERQANVRILGYSHSGFRHLTNSKRPITSLADLKGLKLRVPQSKIMLASYEAWGANPIALAWPEVFTALQQRVIDGQDNPYVVNYSMKFHEIQGYLTEMRHQYSLQPMIVGLRTWKSLGENEREIVRRASLLAQQRSLEFQEAEATKARQAMEAGGVTISRLEDEERWREIAVTQVWPQFYDSVGGKTFVNAIVDRLEAMDTPDTTSR